MELSEHAVLAYISGPRNRFINPQFQIPHADGLGGTCPDFVVLDLKDQTVYVVEVTVSSKMNKLMTRVDARNFGWYEPLRNIIREFGEPFSNWTRYRTALFVRADCWNDVRSRIGAASDVAVIALDEVLRSWKWKWGKGNVPLNPMDRDIAPSSET